MNYARIVKFDTANGPGIRTTLFVSGCSHHCKGCHNSNTWDENTGQPFTDETICEILNSLDHPYIKGLSISGGDPLLPSNRDDVLKILAFVNSALPTKDIWMWTGYTYEEIKDLDILDHVDVLVDGPFILEKRDITHPYHGSSNQRVIDVRKSKELGGVVLWCE